MFIADRDYNFYFVQPKERGERGRKRDGKKEKRKN